MHEREPMVTVRQAGPGDVAAWLELRCALWPESSEAEHREEIARFFDGSFSRRPWVVFLAEETAGDVVGFAELSVRPFAEGCRSSRVAYLEGWFVVPEARTRGVGRALVAAGEEWGREQGCSELASDSDPQNDASCRAHRALGFADAGLVRCFRKDL